ncbi:thiamine pyrophosphate-requiring protein [Alphaproteobacteria bacterium GH1-50]|uniref:Thiamine pyrophosphate-requiring protein n=1 Tax=Kangsaoukella pontilimi TaxID=2691042 RepID=A0A7C9MV11_9RHOB|nr:thiamine pyrophosphate-requiring protein [Kangsaoukella pontilimi]MXQ07320.1 thiamine pyrophosphate-requiring protein [Kangsaoukella pontilimi]
MKDPLANPETGADALLLALSRAGVSYLFANAGTDFPPLIEGLAKLPAESIPTPVTVPHETAAMGMAHGYWLVTGRMQAVMVHVNVGLANAVMGVINAASDDVPVMVLSGRTPLTETGRVGGRITPIQYGQEMFDQTSLVRDAVKFDYEIRYPEQGDSVTTRAAAIALSDPPGPVYLSLPREPLCEALPDGYAPAPATAPARAGAPHGADLDTLVEWIDRAELPLVVCQRGDPAGRLSEALSRAAARLGLAVSEPFVVRNVLAGGDPALLGYGPPPMERADLVIVLDSGVPWIARGTPPAPGAKVVHIGPDPLFGRMPVRGYRSDLTIAADPVLVLGALAARAEPAPDRRKQIEDLASETRAKALAAATPPEPGEVASPAWLSACLSDIMDEDAVVFSELGLLPGAMTLKGPNRFFGNPHSGGLGWGVPAALGAQLADRDRLVIAAVGDGSYMFANPVVCHQVAEALDLPILIVVKNNGGWNAVRRAVRGAYPEGAAMKRNEVPLTSLAPLPDFTAVARASRAHAERIEHGADIPDALARAVRIIRDERRHVLLDVAVAATETF